jgi:hypothetical protein
MGLKPTLDSLDGVPEALHEYYEEKNGSFMLNVEGMLARSELEGMGLNPDDLPGLVKNRDALLTEVKKLKTRYRDVDPEKYLELVAKEEELENEKLKAKGDWDAKERQLAEKFEKERFSWDEDRKAMSGTIEELMVRNVALDELGKAKVISNRVHLIMPWIERMVRVVKDDSGKYVTEVRNPTTGEVRISPKSGSMSPMTIAELVEEMKDSEEYGVCFESDGVSGSGASGAGGKGGSLVATREQMRDPRFYAAIEKRAKDQGKTVNDVVIKD